MSHQTFSYAELCGECSPKTHAKGYSACCENPTCKGRVKAVSIRTVDCPDCGHALLWMRTEREEGGGHASIQNRRLRKPSRYGRF